MIFSSSLAPHTLLLETVLVLCVASPQALVAADAVCAGDLVATAGRAVVAGWPSLALVCQWSGRTAERVHVVLGVGGHATNTSTFAKPRIADSFFDVSQPHSNPIRLVQA